MDHDIALQLLEEVTKIRQMVEAFPKVDANEIRQVAAPIKEVTTPQYPAASIEEVTPVGPRAVRQPSKTPPWLAEARSWVGKNEVDNREELEAYLKINPDGNRGGLPWCAAFMNSVLNACGIAGTGNNMARSFKDWGEDVQEADGVIAVFYNDSDTRGHAGIICENGERLLGGNQGDSVKLNNLPYYKETFDHTEFKWPKEYEHDLT